MTAKITRLVLIVGTTLALMGCAVYAPGPAYYGPPVAVGVYGGWHHGWHRWG
jgi:hypothetical protein